MTATPDPRKVAGRWRRALLPAMLVAFALATLSGCERAPKRSFTILAGVEHRALDGIVTQFCKAQRWTCKIRYTRSLDIVSALASPDAALDAVWPATGLWIDLSDGVLPVRHLRSIMRSPLVFALPRSQGEALGVLGKPVPASQLLELVRAGRLDYVAPSVVQSNSGLLGYLMMAMALSGGAEALDEARLGDPGFQEQMQTWFTGQRRSATGIGTLQPYLVQSGGPVIAPEFSVLAIDRDRAQQKLEPLVAVSLAEGALAVDSPLGFVAHGQRPEAEAFFLALQKYLLSAEVQAQLRGLGFRPVVALPNPQPPGAFDAALGIDPAHAPRLLRPPPTEIVRLALATYQETLRKPSLTVWCLDMSSSMAGERVESLRAAFHALFDSDAPQASLSGASARDRGVVIPFSGEPWGPLRAGSPAEFATLAHRLDGLEPGGGTDYYACLDRALDLMAAHPARSQSLPEIVLVTDGGGEDAEAGTRFAEHYRKLGIPTPIFPIPIGDADPAALEPLAALSQGRVLDGNKDLEGALRDARGYN